MKRFMPGNLSGNCIRTMCGDDHVELPLFQHGQQVAGIVARYLELQSRVLLCQGGQERGDQKCRVVIRCPYSDQSGCLRALKMRQSRVVCCQNTVCVNQ